MDTAYPPQNQQPPPPGVYHPAQVQPGYPGYGHYQGHSSNVVVITQPGIHRGIGNCPSCGVGYLRVEYTPLGLILCLLFFPLGVICCMLTAQKRCSNCRAVFS